MNRRILVSLMVIGLVGAMATTGTLALFSDTETSSDNVFTAGAVDLGIDINSEGPEFNGSILYGQGENPAVPAFFSLSDVKPGDVHERTLSLHVDNNPAWACAAVIPTANDDNGLTEPEAEVDSTGGAGEGELAQQSDLHIWTDGIEGVTGDNAGDNVFNADQEDGDTSVIGPERQLPTGTVVWTIADSDENIYPTHSVGEPLAGSQTYYLGVEYSIPIDVGNVAQTDSYEAAVQFYTEQARNNENFDCQEDFEPGLPGEPQEPVEE